MLDVSVRAGVLAILERLCREEHTAILMITHDLSTAARFADRIAVMYLGRIVELGPAREVIRRPRHPYTQALLAAVPDRDPRARTAPRILSGGPPDPAEIPSGCRFHPRCPLAMARCPTVDPRPAPVTPDGTHRAACLLVPAPPADATAAKSLPGAPAPGPSADLPVAGPAADVSRPVE